MDFLRNVKGRDSSSEGSLFLLMELYTQTNIIEFNATKAITLLQDPELLEMNKQARLRKQVIKKRYI
jgi:hypothetical protein